VWVAHNESPVFLTPAAWERLTLQEAAHRLGVSESAIRKRIKRGTLDHEKTEDGRVLVYLDAASAPSALGKDIGPYPNTGALIAAKDETICILRKHLEAERRANDENRRLLLAAMDRIPALEASSEERGSPETPTEPVPGTGHPRSGGALYAPVVEKAVWLIAPVR